MIRMSRRVWKTENDSAAKRNPSYTLRQSCAAHMQRPKRIRSTLVDSYFLRSKSSKCMEIVSNPAIMDVSHTKASYGPWSGLLAVIEWKVGYRHSLQYATECVLKRTVQSRAGAIYDLQLPISSGDGETQSSAKFTAFKGKRRSICIEIKRRSA